MLAVKEWRLITIYLADYTGINNIRFDREYLLQNAQKPKRPILILPLEYFADLLDELKRRYYFRLSFAIPVSYSRLIIDYFY